MHHLAILLTVVVLLTGTTRADADFILQEGFDSEFRSYVVEPCMKILASKAGVLKFFENGTVVRRSERWALLEAYFGKVQIDILKAHFDKRKIYLFVAIREKSFSVRKAWYAVTAQWCKNIDG